MTSQSEMLAARLEGALADAHLPALLMSLVHLTGDAGLLTPERRAIYEPLAEPSEGGYSPKVQAEIRALAKTAISAYFDGAPIPPEPSRATIRKMMDFDAGADIPEHYVQFLMDELGLGGVDTKTPRWEGVSLKAAASRMKVLVIGAGMSGLLMGFRLRQAGVPFTILDKNPDVGGTWLENVYPGCRVDNPNHMYSYSFEPNHDFPQHFSTQPVLLDYFRRFADRHDLRRDIRFETTVEAAIWDEAAALWRVTVTTIDGRRETLEANAVVSAVGQLNRPRYPDIEGVGSFEGPAFHSARWRQDVDLTGKRVAVIGTGASAYQFVPEIAPRAGHVEVFQRTPPWATPAPHYHDDVTDGKKWLLEHVPYYDKWYRFFLFWILTDGVYEAVKGDADWNGPTNAVGVANAQHRELLAEAMRIQAPDRPDIIEKVVPQYPFGGKRPLVDNGVWINALKRDNVDLITTPIARVTPRGVETRDGAEHAADVLIYGTGFQASRFLWPMRVVGRGGVDLETAWNGDARAYLGMTAPGFPNLFIIYGPNTNIVINGSIVFFSECSVRYVAGCIKLLAQTGARAMEVRRDVHDAFNVKVDKANALMAWGSPHVTSWYKNATGRVSQNWPFPIVEYWNQTVAPNPQDFVLTDAKATVEA
jgi:4-hydroxyacetophenone monooxygenase